MATPVPYNGWKEKFQKVMGEHPDTYGIKDEAQANKVATLAQQMRATQAGGLPPVEQDNNDKTGTTNESISPTKP